MAFVKTNAYNDEQKREMRLRICKQCVFASCNNNNMNTCDVNSLVCVKSSNQNIIVKTNDLAQKCPMNYWALTNKTLDDYIPSPGCGCRK